VSVAIEKDAAQAYVMEALKKSIREKTGQDPDPKYWQGGILVEAVGALVEYLLANNVVTVQATVDPSSHAGVGQGKFS